MDKLRRPLLGALMATVALLAALGATASVAEAATFTPLTLQNGWTNVNWAPLDTPAAANIDGIVHFRGMMTTSGTNAQPFTLPVGFRPATSVYVPVNVCDDRGRLDIEPSGAVSVQTMNYQPPNTLCWVNLDGASFVLSPDNLMPLPLQNGWTNAPFGTSNAAVTIVSGIVQFKGAIAGGTDDQPLTLPVGFRPSTSVYIPVDLCDVNNGRLQIDPSGVVTVEAENPLPKMEHCFTSLDGASFVLSPANLTQITLQPGWTNAPFSTSNAAATIVSGIVHLKGAIATSGPSLQPFTLPVGFRPSTSVYVPIDLCGAHNGTLFIDSTGWAYVVTSVPFNAQCFTSLDGASFAQ